MSRLTVSKSMLCGLAMVVFAAWFLRPLSDRLSAFDGYWRLFAPGEISVYGVGMALAGVALIVGSLAWQLAVDAPWRQALGCDYRLWQRSRRSEVRGLARSRNLWIALTCLVLLGVLLTVRLSFSYQDRGVAWYDPLVIENGLWELLTALTLIAAGCVFVASALRTERRAGFSFAPWPACVLGLALLFAAGEELSWGQHLLGFEVSDSVKTLNQQREFNLHNINTHLSNRLMVLFLLSYLVILPLLASLFGPLQFALERMGIPVCPVALTPFAVVGVLMSDHDLISSLWGNPPWRLSEGRETLFGMIMLGFALCHFLSIRHRRLERLVGVDPHRAGPERGNRRTGDP